MKYVAILLVVVLIASAAGVGWLYMNANVVVEATGVMAVDAATQPELFARLRNQVETGRVNGTLFQSGTLGSAEQYQFYTYTVRLRNDCFFTADMVELQVTPMTGDVLQLGDETARALPARTSGDIQATILTDASMHSVRELNITYYMWGMPFSLRTTTR